MREPNLYDTAAGLVRLIELFAERTGHAESTISRLAAGSGDVIGRLRRGGGITTKRADRILRYLSENWPEDVPRPAQGGVADVRGELAPPSWIVDAPRVAWVVAIRKRLKLSRERFPDRFGLDVRTVQEWEQGRRVPDRTARVLLTVIDHDPESVVKALAAGKTRASPP